MPFLEDFILSRRAVVAGAAASTLASGLGWSKQVLAASFPSNPTGANPMNFITTSDGVQIFYKDWGPRDAQPLVFHHGWPLTADEWDNQLLFFQAKGYRVIAHDRRGHGRSTQTDTGNDMDHYAADTAALVDSLGLKGAVHIGHSTGGGEATHYAARAKAGTIAKLVLIGAVPPVMVRKASNPGGLPMEVFDGFRTGLQHDRSQFYLDIASGPFYGFNRTGAKISEGLIRNWWRQGMVGSAKAHYDCVKAFSETDFTEDLKKIKVPTLVMHGTDDQVVPFADSAPLAVKLLEKGELKAYDGYPHGMAAVFSEVINNDLLKFIKS